MGEPNGSKPLSANAAGSKFSRRGVAASKNGIINSSMNTTFRPMAFCRYIDIHAYSELLLYSRYRVRPGVNGIQDGNPVALLYPVAAHFNSPNHTTQDMKVMIVEQVRKKDSWMRRTRESHWIAILDTIHPTGMNLYP